MEDKKFEKMIKTILKNSFYRKFSKGYSINVNSIIDYLRFTLGFSWLNQNRLRNYINNILTQFYVKLNRLKKRKEIKELQKKYPDLQVTEAFFYLTLNEKMKLKKDDFKLFDEMVEILFSKEKK